MDRLDVLQQCPLDALLDPPGGVRAESCPAVRVEVVHCLDQAEVALLDQVAQTHAAPAVLLRDVHHQSQIAPHELLSRLRVVFLRDPLAVYVLLLSRKQGGLVDFLEVVFECDIENDMLLPPDCEPFGSSSSGHVVIDRRSSIPGSAPRTIPMSASVCTPHPAPAFFIDGWESAV